MGHATTSPVVTTDIVWGKGEGSDSRVERRGQAMASGAWKEENSGRRLGVCGVLGGDGSGGRVAAQLGT